MFLYDTYLYLEKQAYLYLFQFDQKPYLSARSLTLFISSLHGPRSIKTGQVT